jgi:predicted DNA-binding transcriptional regulator AlpA
VQRTPSGRVADRPQTPNFDEYEFIPAPKLRAKLGISAVTLWRWRHDKEIRFPAPKVIKGRHYFPVGAVTAWLARQADAACLTGRAAHSQAQGPSEAA